MNNLWQELKRRNVIKSALAYLVVAWILLQVFQLLLPIVNAPDWVLKGITLVIAIGLPIWIVISWIYDLTPKGIEKTAKDSGSELVAQATNKRLNVFIIVSLSLAVIVLALNQTVFSSNPNQELSIAVIPFDNIKVDQDKEWLSQDFTQNVNSYISKVKKLRVIDSYSAGKYKDTDKTNAEIGEELDVSYVLRGFVTQINNKLSIRVELIDVISNTVDWSDSYDEKFEEDPLRLQQEVSQKIVAELEVALTPNDEKALDNLLTPNQEASIYFNEGVREAHKRTPLNQSMLVTSANLFQKAIDLDPNYAEAYAEKAFVLRLIKQNHEFFENMNKNKTIASLVKKALELDPNSPRAYTTLGAMELFWYFDYNKAKEYLDKALALKPNDATTLHYYALYYVNKPEKDRKNALNYIILAHKSNPFSIPISATVIIRLVGVDKIVEAEEFYKKNSHVFTENVKRELNGYIIETKIKKACIEKKDWSEAINLYHREIDLDTINSVLYRKLAGAYKNILNDDKNYLKYAKKAFELGELYSENADLLRMSSNADAYFFALLKNKEFDEVNNLLLDDYFTSLFSKEILFNRKFYKYYYQGNYTKAQDYIDNYIFTKDIELSINYAQQNDIKKVTSILNKDILRPYQKAIVFAVLKERDSMYHYMNKESDIYRIIEINGSIEVDAYRKEDRYKAFLKKNYLPLTHWNE